MKTAAEWNEEADRIVNEIKKIPSTLTDADLKDGITGPELETAVLKMTAETVHAELVAEVERKMRDEGLTFDEIFGDPDPDAPACLNCGVILEGRREPGICGECKKGTIWMTKPNRGHDHVLNTPAPPVLSGEEADRLLDYVVKESTMFPGTFYRGRVEIEIPATVERIEAVAEAKLPGWAYKLLAETTEAQRAGFLDWLEEVVDRAVGGATGLGGPYD